MKKLTYLCSPYSHQSPEVREQRFRDACLVSAKLMQRGILVFSSIVHNHSIALAGGLPTGWEFWEGYDLAILEACKDICVLTIDGWVESKGVQAEVRMACDLGIPVTYVGVDGEVIYGEYSLRHARKLWPK